MTIDRRRLLAASGAAALTGALPAIARAQTGEDAKLLAAFERYFEQNLDDSPQLCTSLNLDNGTRAGQKSKLDDVSIAARKRRLERTRARVAELKAIDRAALSAPRKVDYDVILYGQQQALDLGDRFKFGGRPYVLSQQNGAYSSIPNSLDTNHRVASKADADAYLERLKAFAVVLDQNLETLADDVSQGMVPPVFVCDLTLAQLHALRDKPAIENNLATSIGGKAWDAGLTADYLAPAANIVETQVYPALDRTIKAVEALKARGRTESGIGGLKEGPALYAALLKQSTTTDLSPAEVHKMGLDQVADITSQIDVILKAQGYSQGTVGARMAALNRDPAQLYANTDAGRDAMLADLNRQMAIVQARLPEAFRTLPKSKVEVRRVPVNTQDGASNGYYQSGAPDGSRPGAFYINLKDTSEWPRYSLPTLVYHEATPGHHLQIALTQEAEALPRLRRNGGGGGSSAYTEGWGLYAEQLADEMGLYKDYPLGRAGFLQSFLFRATRLVVDTGIHTQGWSREKATDYMTEVTGYARTRNAREIERYCVNPGQACSYKIGHNRWVSLREDAKKKLGAKFDLKAFHDAGLLAGSMPLTVLERRIAEWVGSVA